MAITDLPKDLQKEAEENPLALFKKLLNFQEGDFVTDRKYKDEAEFPNFEVLFQWFGLGDFNNTYNRNKYLNYKKSYPEYAKSLKEGSNTVRQTTHFCYYLLLRYALDHDLNDVIEAFLKEGVDKNRVIDFLLTKKQDGEYYMYKDPRSYGNGQAYFLYRMIDHLLQDYRKDPNGTSQEKIIARLKVLERMIGKEKSDKNLKEALSRLMTHDEKDPKQEKFTKSFGFAIDLLNKDSNSYKSFKLELWKRKALLITRVFKKKSKDEGSQEAFRKDMEAIKAEIGDDETFYEVITNNGDSYSLKNRYQTDVLPLKDILDTRGYKKLQLKFLHNMLEYYMRNNEMRENSPTGHLTPIIRETIEKATNDIETADESNEERLTKKELSAHIKEALRMTFEPFNPFMEIGDSTEPHVIQQVFPFLTEKDIIELCNHKKTKKAFTSCIKNKTGFAIDTIKKIQVPGKETNLYDEKILRELCNNKGFIAFAAARTQKKDELDPLDTLFLHQVVHIFNPALERTFNFVEDVLREIKKEADSEEKDSISERDKLVKELLNAIDQVQTKEKALLTPKKGETKAGETRKPIRRRQRRRSGM